MYKPKKKRVSFTKMVWFIIFWRQFKAGLSLRNTPSLQPQLCIPTLLPFLIWVWETSRNWDDLDMHVTKGITVDLVWLHENEHMLLSKYSQERNYWIVISNNSKSSVPNLKKVPIMLYFSSEQQHLKLFIKLTWIRNAEVVLQKSFWLAYLVYICNTVESNSQLSQIFTQHERSIATAIGKRAWLHALLFTSLYKSINMVGMPGKVNPPELCACTYESVHVYLHMHNCVLMDVCVCVQNQNSKSISSIQWGISSKPTASNYNRPWSHCLFSLSFICLPSASYGCSLH